MIIIEGPDNAGKTTLAKLLSKLISFEVIHAGSRPKSQGEVDRRYMEAIGNCDRNVIQDRNFIVGQAVYGKVMNDNFVPMEDAINKLAKSGAIYIYCRPANNVLLDLDNHDMKPHDNKEDFDIVMDKAEQIIELYDDLHLELGKRGMSISKHDYTKGQISLNTLDFIARRIDDC